MQPPTGAKVGERVMAEGAVFQRWWDRSLVVGGRSRHCRLGKIFFFFGGAIFFFWARSFHGCIRKRWIFSERAVVDIKDGYGCLWMFGRFCSCDNVRWVFLNECLDFSWMFRCVLVSAFVDDGWVLGKPGVFSGSVEDYRLQRQKICLFGSEVSQDAAATFCAWLYPCPVKPFCLLIHQNSPFFLGPGDLKWLKWKPSSSQVFLFFGVCLVYRAYIIRYHGNP